MPPEGIDSLNTDSLKSQVLSLLAKIDELLEQNKTLLAYLGAGGTQRYSVKVFRSWAGLRDAASCRAALGWRRCRWLA
jgi:DNA topoisomerase IB